MTVIDLSHFKKLNEGVYPNAVLNEIVLKFDQDHPGVLKWIETKFTVDSHQIKDLFFVDGDDRLGYFVESIKKLQENLQLDDKIWFDMPCSLKLTQDETNGHMYWHTHDWKWDSEVYSQRVLKSKHTNKSSQGTGHQSLLEDIKKQSKGSNDELFKGTFDKESDN
ncbi:hypothetical protein M1857_04110 [Lactiplantibacillus plantarum]|nr:hypothetical protein M1857_04110 [Lactiplantibacillus plantarum]